MKNKIVCNECGGHGWDIKIFLHSDGTTSNSRIICRKCQSSGYIEADEDE